MDFSYGDFSSWNDDGETAEERHFYDRPWAATAPQQQKKSKSVRFANALRYPFSKLASLCPAGDTLSSLSSESDMDVLKASGYAGPNWSQQSPWQLAQVPRQTPFNTASSYAGKLQQQKKPRQLRYCRDTKSSQSAETPVSSRPAKDRPSNYWKLNRDHVPPITSNRQPTKPSHPKPSRHPKTPDKPAYFPSARDKAPGSRDADMKNDPHRTMPNNTVRGFVQHRKKSQQPRHDTKPSQPAMRSNSKPVWSFPGDDGLNCKNVRAVFSFSIPTPLLVSGAPTPDQFDVADSETPNALWIIDRKKSQFYHLAGDLVREYIRSLARNPPALDARTTELNAALHKLSVRKTFETNAELRWDKIMRQGKTGLDVREHVVRTYQIEDDEGNVLEEPAIARYSSTGIVWLN